MSCKLNKNEIFILNIIKPTNLNNSNCDNTAIYRIKEVKIT